MTVTELDQHDAHGEGVVDLADALHLAVVGAKASALARAARAGLPVLPGFVLTPAAARALSGDRAAPELVDRARAAWQALSDDGTRPLVVRSSATTEDSLTSSMAGRFTSVLDVAGWERFRDAVRQVVASAAAVEAGPDGTPTAMAVLVQPQLDPEAGGIAFGADPVTGRRDRIVVSARRGGPDPLVKGEERGAQLVLSPRGRLRRGSERFAPLAARTTRRELARVVARTAQHFGRPQDIEWALHDGHVVLLQSRPITTLAAAALPGRGPVYGPAPLAETFPDPLHRLERELWIEPLVRAARTALPLLGTATRRTVATRPLVIAPRGRVAADLALFGVTERSRGARAVLARLDPRAPVRHLAAAWRIGRLRVALPALGRDVLRDTDRLFRQVPAPRHLSDDELLVVARRSRDALVTLHCYEMLAGQLLSSEVTFSAAGEALRVLASARARDPERPDAEHVADHPVLLALCPPRVGGTTTLPQAPGALPPPRGVSAAEALREALRLRIRWMQELGARVVLELGRRHAGRGALPSAAAVRDLTLTDLEHLAHGVRPPAARWTDDFDPTPLPARFRLARSGAVVAETGRRPPTGRGAGGGRGSGTVVTPSALPAPGAVLVVRTLDPALAPLLGSLEGLVAETGSPLSHLAILAREYGVPTVVGVHDAVGRFPEGTRLLVDGGTGEVHELPEPRDDEVPA